MSLTRKILLNASVMGVGRVVMAAIGLVSVGISTRYLGLEVWGSFAAATAFVSILSIFTDIGLWTIGAREIAKRPHETRQIVSSLLTVGIFVSLAAGAIGLGGMFLIYPGAENELVRRGILLLMATVPLSAPLGAAGAYFVAQQQAYIGVFCSLIASVVTVGLVATAAALDWGFNGIVLAYVAFAACQGALVIALSARHVPPRLSFDLRVGRQLFMWALPLGGVRVISSIYWRLDLILLSLLKPGSEVALYGVSARVVDALAGLPNIVMVTLLPEFARLTSARERFDEIVQKAFSVLQVAAVALFVFFAGFAPEIVRLVGGRAFEDAAVILQILMVAVALMYCGSVFGQGFIAHNKQSQSLLAGVAVLPLNAGLNLALIPVWGARGAAVAWVLSEVVSLAIVATLYRRFATLPRLHHTSRVLVAGCAAASVPALKIVLVPAGVHPALVLSVGGVLTMAVYALALYALNAMPREVHANLVVPLWARLKPPILARAKSP